MISISKCIFKISFLLFASTLTAQNNKTDSTSLKSEKFGIRIGADLYKIARSSFDKNYQGIEFVGDYKLTKKYYIAGELGNENNTTIDDRLTFTTKGSYFKAGFDYNFYENWLDMENLIYIGARYGVSSFSQELHSYKIYNTNPYFGEAPNVISGEKYNGLTASWFEVVVGMKAELFSNLYAGFSVRMNRLISNGKPFGFDNLYIPGFNRTYDGSFGVGLNYTVTYFIPVYKKNKSVKSKKTD